MNLIDDIWYYGAELKLLLQKFIFIFHRHEWDSCYCEYSCNASHPRFCIARTDYTDGCDVIEGEPNRVKKWLLKFKSNTLKVLSFQYFGLTCEECGKDTTVYTIFKPDLETTEIRCKFCSFQINIVHATPSVEEVGILTLSEGE